ncbi:MAG: hypothetical protein E7505_04920 [Ruminococcus sp.]|nr:hypothetical protein [Ruminococcus sp.]
MKKIETTPLLTTYLIKLLIRLTVFVSFLIVYIFHKDILIKFMTDRSGFGITEYNISPLHILWAVFMVMMFIHLFPPKLFTMALKKGESGSYIEVKGYDKKALSVFIKQQNKRALIVMILWVLFNSVFAVLYRKQLIDSADLLMLTVFYFLCDYICIIFYCPFQNYIMKNKCCVNCRIYDWGHFMMFTPMLFVKNFFCRSLFFMSLIVLIKWEIIYAAHPERFWSGSNLKLRCSSCQDKTCRIKKLLQK